MTVLLSNPPNPWATAQVELLGPPPDVPLQVYEERSKSILSRNDSDDLAFEWSVNPYRGCFHACAYCYARRTHEYLDWGAGSDFDRRIVVKVDAPELLREAFARRSWKRQTVAFSGVTDCYQPLEATYGLTRRCLEVCAEFSTPVGIITKGALIERDVDVLDRVRSRAGADVAISIPFSDDACGQALEPFAARPSRRFETIRRLADAGIPVSVAVAPLIPGLNDHQIPEVLARAAEAGATRASMTLLRLPGSVHDVFFDRLQQAFPDRAAKVLHALEEARGTSGLRESRFGERMVGHGPRWDVAWKLFSLHTRRLGMTRSEGGVRDPHRTRSACEPEPRQQTLFDDR